MTTDLAAQQAPAPSRTAAALLLLATVFWGTSFTWAKVAFAAANVAAHQDSTAAFGSLFVLAVRFLAASIIWFVCFPKARRGWTWASARRAGSVGLLLGISIVVQSIGLTRTSEAVSAFLTSLTILFVPLLLTVGLRRPPRPVLWLGVGIATLGVWMMTGAQPTGFGSGEFLGLACSFCFSVYILTVNWAVARDSPWRISGGQFAVTGILCLLACGLAPGGIERLRPAAAVAILRPNAVWTNTALLTSLATVVSFGLLTQFQPRLDATRAALIYLLEPVFAAAYAAWAAKHGLTRLAVAGGGLILAANILVEWIASMRDPVLLPGRTDDPVERAGP